MNGDWVDHELHNWARWCNSGPMPHPTPWECMGQCCSLEGGYLSPEQTGPSDLDDLRKPLPIHAENAKVVQRVFDVSIYIERKVLQAEYLSPWQYARYSSGIGAAARRLKLSTPAYETILANLKQRVEKAFR
jgi:hypothetical protein